MGEAIDAEMNYENGLNKAGRGKGKQMMSLSEMTAGLELQQIPRMYSVQFCGIVESIMNGTDAGQR